MDEDSYESYWGGIFGGGGIGSTPITDLDWDTINQFLPLSGAVDFSLYSPSDFVPISSEDFQTTSGRLVTQKMKDGSTITINKDTGEVMDVQPASSGDSGIAGTLGKAGSALLKMASSPAGLMTMLGAGYAMTGNRNAPQADVYKGSIPTYTAVREKVAQPTYTPYTGQAVMGRDYFTPMQYVKEKPEEARAAAQTQAANIAAGIASAPAAAVSPLPKPKTSTAMTQAEADALVEETRKSYGAPLRMGDKTATQPAFDINRVKAANPNLDWTKYDPNKMTMDRDQFDQAIDYYRRTGQGMKPMQPIDLPTAPPGLAKGGIATYLRGKSDGMADKIPASIEGKQPARLSHGEFVVPADVVSHLGNGNSEAGAQALYKMMDRVRQARTGTTKQGKQINPDKYTGIAKYASGGTVNFQSGGSATAGLSPTASNPTGSTATTNLAPWVGDYVTDYLGKGQALANQPYQAYTGPLSAGVSPLQTQAFEAAGKYDPLATFDATAAQQYMNPFLEAALRPQLESARREAEITRLGQLGRMSKAGAYGGSRQAIMESELSRNLMDKMSGITGQGYATAFDRAMQQYNLGRQQTIGDIKSLADLGTRQRDIEQQGIEAGRKEFETQRQYPYEQLKFQQSLLQGLPVGTTSVTPNLSDIQQLGLSLKQLQDLYKTLSAIPGFGGSTPAGTSGSANPSSGTTPG